MMVRQSTCLAVLLMIISPAAFAQTPPVPGLPELPSQQQPAVQLPEVQVPATPAPAVAAGPTETTTTNTITTTNTSSEPAEAAPAQTQETQNSGQPAPDTQTAEKPVDAATAQPAAATGEAAIATGEGPKEVVAEKEKNFIASYGTYGKSVFFTEEEIKRMKQVLYISESFKGEAVSDKPQTDDTAFNDLLGSLNNKATVDVSPITEFPSFYVSTIVYKSPSNWSLWLNGNRVTPKRVPAGIEVVAVSQTGAQFLWKPEKFLQFKAYWDDIEAGKVAKPPARSLSQAAKVTFDKKNSAWVFTVKTNQTFASQYMAVLEGKHDAQSSVTPPAAPVANTVQPVVEPPLLEDPDKELRATSEELQRQDRQLSGIGRPRPKGLLSDVPPTPEPAPTPAQDSAATVSALLGALSKAADATSGTAGNGSNNTVGLPVLPSQ
jgi:hypothetical protein